MFRFIPAAFVSNFTPLLVLLVNEENALDPFEYKMWNLLFVDLDKTQEESEILRIIEHYQEECEAGEYLYIYAKEALREFAMMQKLEENGYKIVLQNYTPKRLNIEKMMEIREERLRLEMMMDALAFEEI